MNRWIVACWLLVGGLIGSASLPAVELVELTAENWDEFAPQGKEVDCIYGDYVLRNEQIVAVIARPGAGRNANMTVRGVGGAIIDLTRRTPANDQLSAFYPGAGKYGFHDAGRVKVQCDGQAAEVKSDAKVAGEKITVEIVGEPVASTAPAAKPADKIELTLRYSLADGEESLLVETSFKNAGPTPLTIERSDAIRADRTFAFGGDPSLHLHWANDDFFKQAYGVVAADFEIKPVTGRLYTLQYTADGKADFALPPGESAAFSRRVFPADHLLAAKAAAAKLAGIAVRPIRLKLIDPNGTVPNAKVSLTADGKPYGSGRGDEQGTVLFSLPAGKYDVTIEAQGRPATTLAINVPPVEDPDSLMQLAVSMDPCGYAVIAVTDESGGPIPCKIAFHGKMPTKTPNFGPDSAAEGVENLRYTADGRVRQELAPGKYEVIISRGPEYDAVFEEIEIVASQETKVAAKLIRTVDTRGHVSADYHSHSTPSGDNTSDQLGRVLNLLGEHVEFAPCTEHNRIDSYEPHLKRLKAERLLATCTGMELTGAVLPVNHQNAFPLLHKPRTQDGGAPVTDLNPEVQIERLAMWDGGSEKLVQENHPNLLQIFGDKDKDGKFDGGFAKMLKFMDVVEVHPPQGIFTPPKAGEDPSLNPIFRWLQLTNLGYRIPGVVNTDAHYNAHGSGWLRNYVRCSTDDPAEIDTMEMVHASEKGQIVMSTGPFLEVRLTATGTGTAKPASAGPGEDLALPKGTGELHVRVQCPNWFDVNRVQVFLNGRPVPDLNFTRRETPDRFRDTVVKFEARLPIELKNDAPLIVATIGEGQQLGRVMGATYGKEPPVAVSNPIFIDVDGNGFKPSRDLLDVALPMAAN